MCTRPKETYILSRLRATSALKWSDKNIEELQNKDNELKEVFTWIQKGLRPNQRYISDKSRVLKHYWSIWDSLKIDGGILKRKWESVNGKSHRFQTILPKNLRDEVLKIFHETGHLGMIKTLDRIRQHFYWSEMKFDVENWINRCDSCQKVKGSRLKGQLKVYNVGAPWERIAIDVAGPFPTTESGNKYTLVVQDYFSKWVEVYTMPNQEAGTVAKCVVDNWVCRYGVPTEIHSDQGRNFESFIFTEMCTILNITKTRTTPLHPQSDGMVERFNRTLEEYLKKVVKDQKNWDKYIPIFLLAYRTATHKSTGFSPCEMIFGRNVAIPAEILFGIRTNVSSATDYGAFLRNSLEQIHEVARDNLNHNADRMKTSYDILAHGTTYDEGDLVLLFNPQRRKGISPKLINC